LHVATAALLLLGLGQANAVYINRFSTIANGAVTFTGNTLGLDKAAGANAPGTSGAIGTFTTTNLSLVDGTYPPGTTADWRLNSSAAQLVIPAGSTILYAELIWSGSYSYGGENVSAALNNAVGFLTPSGSTTVTPSATTAQIKGVGTAAGACTTTPCYYVRSADVTSLVRAAGAGTYTISGVPATQGNTENNANAAGWTLAVVYQNGAMPSRNLSLFVGAELGGDPAATVTGFCTPPTGPRSGRLLVSAMEGDSSIAGDQMQFGASAAALTALSGPNNGVGNFFAGQINGDSGARDTTGTFGASNHTTGASTAGARQGYDITNVDVSAQLANNQTIAAARGTTTGDQYLINALALQINVGAPIFPISTKTANRAVAKVGDIITYTVALDNRTGTADATNVIFRDPLPAGLSYVPNTFTIDTVANAGNPVTGTNIGTVAAGTQRTAVFQARVDSIPSAPALAQYDNSASWDYEFIPCAGQPVSRGNLITNPASTKIARLLPSKSTAPVGAVSPNDVITYTVTLKNDGTADSSGTTLADPIPANTTYVAGSTRLNGTLISDIGGAMPFLSPNLLNSPSVASGILATGQSAVVTFQVRVNSSASGTITNTATGDIDGSGGAPSNQVSVSNAVGLLADLSVVKTGPATLTPAGNVAYNIVISNAGPSAANGTTFLDNVPASLLTPSATCISSGGGAACPASIGVAGNSVSGTIATLPSGGSITLQVIATVAASATGNIANTVSVSPPAGTSDPSTGNNASTATGVVNPVADIVVTKTGPASSSAGSALSYQVVIRNDGPSAAHGASFSDVVPASITGVTASCGSALAGAVCPGSVGISGNTVSGSIPTLPTGASVTITINGTVTASAIGSIANTASASPPGGTVDPNAGNSSSTATTTLGSLADVAVAKTGPSAFVPGAAVNYTQAMPMVRALAIRFQAPSPGSAHLAPMPKVEPLAPQAFRLWAMSLVAWSQPCQLVEASPLTSPEP
jgi:large repetitive protein